MTNSTTRAGIRDDLTSEFLLREGRLKYPRRIGGEWRLLAMKWLTKTIAGERRALERARRRFIEKPNEKRLHDVRTTGRRFRSLLEDVAAIEPSEQLRRLVKRAATATDAARDATIILRLLESSVDPTEAELAVPLLEELRKQERLATRRACQKLRRMRFTP
jgi:CHAD domain-containing protein